MLNYAAISLSNPLKPELPPIKTMALVIQDEEGLIVSGSMVTRLGLDAHEKRTINIFGIGSRDVPCTSPLQVTCGQKVASVRAIVAGQEAVMGAALAKELGLPVATSSATQPASRDFKVISSAAEHSDPQLLIVENFIDADTCRELCEYARTREKHRLGVVDHDKTAGNKLVAKIDTSARDTLRVDLEPHVTTRINDMLLRAFNEKIEPFYGVQIENWENPQYLYYPVGGRYGVHADAEAYKLQPDGTKAWERSQNRDISVLLYLNDDFKGGLLYMPNQHLKIQPRPGMLVAFPSSSEYKHGAESTESGERCVIVSWSQVLGSHRVESNNPYGIVNKAEYARSRAGQN